MASENTCIEKSIEMLPKSSLQNRFGFESANETRIALPFKSCNKCQINTVLYKPIGLWNVNSEKEKAQPWFYAPSKQMGIYMEEKVN